MKKMIFLVDFDGTCVTHEYPKVGRNIGAGPVLRNLVKNGHKIILFTMRSYPKGDLKDAVEWFQEQDIPLFGINENPTQWTWTNSPKPYGHYIIDDTSIGCPLSFGHVDWHRIVDILYDKGYIDSNEYLHDEIDYELA